MKSNRNTSMKKALILAMAVSIFGCSAINNLMFPRKDGRSIIGICIRTETPLIIKYKPEAVYFVKLDKKDEHNLGAAIIQSNYIKGDYEYLVNAEPGKYAAVASYFTHGDTGYNTLFNAAIIEQSVVEVGPDQVVFAGEFDIDNTMKSAYNNIEKNGDAAQLHYYKLLKDSLTGYFYSGTPHQVIRNRNAEKNFLLKTKAYLKDSKWSPLIDKRVESFE
jgi:hypothetical protein